VVASGHGSAASLTPPVSPLRGTELCATPGAQRRAFCELKDAGSLELPGLSKPPLYTRRRSRSLDEQETVTKKPAAAKDDDNRLSAVAEVVLDMILPETDHSLRPCNSEIAETIHDESKTALVVNRKLYRAHRQMRLAVLEASKRFEEQQAEHAKQLISAAREASEKHRIVQAGLVMRHGHKKQVSTKSIRALLERNREQQNSLVEKANRSSGRGRRSKKDGLGHVQYVDQPESGGFTLGCAQVGRLLRRLVHSGRYLAAAAPRRRNGGGGSDTHCGRRRRNDLGARWSRARRDGTRRLSHHHGSICGSLLYTGFVPNARRLGTFLTHTRVTTTREERVVMCHVSPFCRRPAFIARDPLPRNLGLPKASLGLQIQTLHRHSRTN